MNSNIKFLGNKPVYSSDVAVGADLMSAESGSLQPGEFKIVPTGTFLEMPRFIAGFIHPRSGLAAKHGITVLNAPGTIDPDYRGEIGVILYNSSDKVWEYEVGTRIAQIVFQHFITANFVETDKFTETNRGTGGFGSTGV